MNMLHLMHRRVAMANPWLLQCRPPVHQHARYIYSVQKLPCFLPRIYMHSHANRWQYHWRLSKEYRLTHVRRGKDMVSVQGEVRAHVCWF